MIERCYYKLFMFVRLELFFYVFIVIGFCEVLVKWLNIVWLVFDL